MQIALLSEVHEKAVDPTVAR